MKKITMTILLVTMIGSMVSCGKNTSTPASTEIEESAAVTSTTNEPAVVYADAEFIESLKIGLQNRWDISEKDKEILKENDGVYPDVQTMKESYSKCVNAELEQLEEYPSRQFEDTKLQGSAIAYINILNDSLACIDKYLPADEFEFGEEWEKIYSQRSKAIKEFVNTYGLTVDEQYQSTLDDFLSTASYVEEKEDKEGEVQQLVNSIKFELKKDDYGYKTYSAVVENTTGISFEYMNLEINLLDEDGVIVESTYSSVENFNSGSKARFEFDTMEEFETYEIDADWKEK